MRLQTTFTAFLVVGMLSASAVWADCSGGNGRGWASGKGKGEFEMAAGDKSCAISFPNFIDDAANTKIPATDVTVTKAPKSGTLGTTSKGLVYTPNAGFKGKDKFCTKNTTPKVKGKALSGCITVTVP